MSQLGLPAICVDGVRGVYCRRTLRRRLNARGPHQNPERFGCGPRGKDDAGMHPVGTPDEMSVADSDVILELTGGEQTSLLLSIGLTRLPKSL